MNESDHLITFYHSLSLPLSLKVVVTGDTDVNIRVSGQSVIVDLSTMKMEYEETGLKKEGYSSETNSSQNTNNFKHSYLLVKSTKMG